jgi:thymidylate kinase
MYIVVEGLDGAGKSTVARMIAKQYGVEIRENPSSDSFWGGLARKLLKQSKPSMMVSLAITLLCIQERILAKKNNTVNTRGILSTIVYTPQPYMWAIRLLIKLERKPDLIVFVEASPEECYRRLKAREGDKKLDLYETLPQLREMEDKFKTELEWLEKLGVKVVKIDNNNINSN